MSLSKRRVDGIDRDENNDEQEWGNDMAFEPKMEHASRPGVKTAIGALAIGAGIALIVFWSQIKAFLS